MTGPDGVNPAAAGTADGVLIASPWKGQPVDVTPSRCAATSAKASLEFKSGVDSQVQRVNGREAQTLALLLERGPEGLTSGEASPLGWARRTSGYIHRLRRRGLAIVTASELTGDGARVGRYILAEPVVVVAEVANDR
jgi:hypothetical protein